MDPIGFGLENFDAIGSWRDRDSDGSTIDASGVLPGGTTFNGAKELAVTLKADPRLTGCVVRQLLTYAIGRGPTPADACAMQEMTRKFDASANRLPDLFSIVASSEVFTQRRGEANP
jgi:hypothetical protein